MNSIELYQKAIEKYGIKLQLIVCIEEMSELSKVLCKIIRKSVILNDEEYNNLVEEIADSEIMFEQIKEGFGIPNCDIQEQKDKKLKRLEERLK